MAKKRTEQALKASAAKPMSAATWNELLANLSKSGVTVLPSTPRMSSRLEFTEDKPTHRLPDLGDQPEARGPIYKLLNQKDKPAAVEGYFFVHNGTRQGSVVVPPGCVCLFRPTLLLKDPCYAVFFYPSEEEAKRQVAAAIRDAPSVPEVVYKVDIRRAPIV